MVVQLLLQDPPPVVLAIRIMAVHRSFMNHSPIVLAIRIVAVDRSFLNHSTIVLAIRFAVVQTLLQVPPAGCMAIPKTCLSNWLMVAPYKYPDNNFIIRMAIKINLQELILREYLGSLGFLMDPC